MASQICEERSEGMKIGTNTSDDNYSDSPKRLKIEANTSDDNYSDSPKRQKIEANTSNDNDSEETLRFYDYYEAEEGTREEIRQFYDEWHKSQGFEIDFSKLTYWSVWKPLDLDASTWVDEPETNGDLIAMLAKAALTERNAENGTSLELDKVLRANYHPATGVTLYISLEVNDPSESDGHQTKPYRAVVGYLRRDLFTVYSCDPK